MRDTAAEVTTWTKKSSVVNTSSATEAARRRTGPTVVACGSTRFAQACGTWWRRGIASRAMVHAVSLQIRSCNGGRGSAASAARATCRGCGDGLTEPADAGTARSQAWGVSVAGRGRQLGRPRAGAQHRRSGVEHVRHRATERITPSASSVGPTENGNHSRLVVGVRQAAIRTEQAPHGDP